VLAKQSREGWFQSRMPAGFRLATTPALSATPPTQEGWRASQNSIHSQLL
jgi:hypothetical protein